MHHLKKILLIILMAIWAVPTQAFENPFKRGRGVFTIGDRKIKLTRSTSCRKSRHRGWTKDDSCVCCLLKRGLRKNGFRPQGRKALEYCLKTKKYCSVLSMAILARKHGMTTNLKKLDYKKFHRALWNEHQVKKPYKRKSKPSFFQRLFRRSSTNYYANPEANPTATDTSSFAEEQAERTYEVNLSPADRAALESKNPGTVDVIFYQGNSVLFGRLLTPVTIGNKAYGYVIVKSDKITEDLADRRYIIFPRIKKSKVGRVPNLLLKYLVDESGFVVGSSIRATGDNTVMPIYNAK